MNSRAVPDHTAIRVALWRALHVQLDAPPPVLDDCIGLELAAPEEGWQRRPDMHPDGTRGYRASIVARARLIEDLVRERLQYGVRQYVILGAGLDTFAQRNPELLSQLQVFEIDKPETQNWKRERLAELRARGKTFAANDEPNLHFVAVDFEAGDSWWQKLKQNSFIVEQPATVASTGVSMYLTREANMATLRQNAELASGSTFAMTFMLPTDMVEAAEQPMYQTVQDRARASGTPFVSLFRPSEILDMARAAGFRTVRHISKREIVERYFRGRSDGLEPASGEDFLIATT